MAHETPTHEQTSYPRVIPTRRSPLLLGAAAGMVAGAMMAMYAMVASAIGFGGQGFFTPL